MAERYIVFADVDETLIRPKSMLAFMEYLLERAPFAARIEGERVRAEYAAIRAVHGPAVDRSILNRRYYGLFEGIAREEIERSARAWIEGAMSRGDFFIAAPCAELASHARAGAELVLVSGSFGALLGPVAAHFAADGLLCTELEIVDGVYTGSLLRQIIGEGKWDAIRDYLRGRADVNLESCYGYGDHVTDVCFMEKMGHPVVVGDSAAMLAIASERRWRCI